MLSCKSGNDANEQTNECHNGHNVPNQFLTFVMEIKTRLTKYDGATTSATQPRIYDNIGKNRYFRFDDVIKLS